MAEAAMYCATAILVAIILAGGLNRAAFYSSKALVAYLHQREKARIRRAERELK